jgi:hypothetical protein
MQLFAGVSILDHCLYGRAGKGTLTQSFESETLSRRQVQGADELRAASRIVKQDAQVSL